MDKKFEQLITLYLNEGDKEQARALFHDIIVEKSREIYESILEMDEGSPVESLMNEINVEEEGLSEEDEEFGMDDLAADDEMAAADDELAAADDEESAEDDLGDMGDMDDADMDDMEAGEGEGELEDRVVDLEDKLDQLMAEFEDLMGKEGDEEGDEEAAADDEMDAADDEEAAADDEEDAAADEEDADEEMMESKLTAVKKVSNESPKAMGPALQSGPRVESKAHAVKFDAGSAAEGKKPTVGSMHSGSYKNTGGKTGAKLETVSKPAKGEQPKGRSPVAMSESKKVAATGRVVSSKK